ncbi:MAG: sulfite exporter TauE/SafE family protein [Solirubrobacteraceae bacterium]
MLLVAAVALLAAVVQAATGLGFALVLGPALFALLDPENAVVAVTVLGLALNVLVLFGERRRPEVAWGEVRPILLTAIPGAACGVLVLRALPKPWLQVAVGAAVIAAAALRVRARALAVPPAPGDPRARMALGFASGTLTTSAGVNGPPIALWLTRRGLSPAEVRDSLSAAFMGLGLIGAAVLGPVLAAAGHGVGWGGLAAGAVAVVAGHAAGHRVFARIDAERYEPLVVVLVVAAGLASVVAGVVALS